MSNRQNAVANAAMLIRRPAPEVYEAFIDPAITSKFWFTGGNARLDAGKRVEWRWDMYGFSIPVDVRELIPPSRIVADWGEGDDRSTVEWRFKDQGDGTTFVTIVNDGFHGSPDEATAKALDSTGGFALVLAGLKAWLEYGVELNLVRDRFPQGLAD